MCFPSLSCVGLGWADACVIMGVVGFLFCSFPSSSFSKAGFVAAYCLNLFLSCNILFSPSMVNASFSKYSSLGFHPWSLIVCSTSIQDLLAFMVSIEKSGIILIGFPLYVT